MSILRKEASDIVVLAALRSPITRSVKGGLAKLSPEELLYQMVKGITREAKIPKELIDDVVVGTVLQTLGGQKASALAIKAAGFPIRTTVNTINRQCASSAQAVSYGASSIRTGENDIVLAAGVESMTHDYFPHRGIPIRINEALKNTASMEAQNVLMPMGITSENVAEKYGISRKLQDEFALQSHLKATKAAQSGHFSHEIIPFKTRVSDDVSSQLDTFVEKDDGIRPNTTLQKLASLKPVFKDNGCTTAGNSSQISDGASAVLLTSRIKADELGIKPIARFLGSHVAGVPSDLMGIGPSAAIPNLLNRFKLDIKDVDIFELNEAFASQSIYCIEKLRLDYEKVNPYGGAIALGHPLGATGVRVLSTLLNGLRAQEKEVGIMSMCTSTGQGYAALLVNEA